MQSALDGLVERLRKAHGDDLVSVILYGSAVTPVEHDPGFSDLNVLCVLKELSTKQIARSEPVFRWWGERQSLAPLLLAENELKGATDCFAIEFHDMRRRRNVLFGRDMVADLHIDPTAYRAQVEYELRSKLLRLRQKSVGIYSDQKLLARLLLDSVTAFCILTRHALLLQGFDAPLERRAVLRLAGETMGISVEPFEILLDAREKRPKAGQFKPQELLKAYLCQIERIVEAVDRVANPANFTAEGDL